MKSELFESAPGPAREARGQQVRPMGLRSQEGNNGFRRWEPKHVRPRKHGLKRRVGGGNRLRQGRERGTRYSAGPNPRFPAHQSRRVRANFATKPSQPLRSAKVKPAAPPSSNWSSRLFVPGSR